MSLADAIREPLEAVVATLEEQLQSRINATEQQCAIAMEHAASQAEARLAADRDALLATGAQQERQRALALLDQQLEALEEGGTNALCLRALRRQIAGEGIDG